eukprot:CAMPEP_0204190100 /NCGR_PEP_ID=MMETSP0361-20130328/59039_1 /ASSEMBLY_ACC=CAM_ASM_000343 /TAXON_ID=268821 /ORGANISM="Scrippsiella Hangoei, Strain SHTV-5" /LENGTH=94 /DNA_ID=CAMNT_0051150865 /DNA_START=260 /DNA_END=541 /DNA_ORIENTATION=+
MPLACTPLTVVSTSVGPRANAVAIAAILRPLAFVDLAVNCCVEPDALTREAAATDIALIPIAVRVVDASMTMRHTEAKFPRKSSDGRRVVAVIE